MTRLTGVRNRSRPPLMIARPADGPAPVPTRAASGTKRADRTAGTPTAHDPSVPQPPPQEPGLPGALLERTADLQRLKAEYDNYRKRVRRDRLAVREIAVANVLGRLLPVLDALAEATEQGEVTGGFRQVARTLETELAGLGLRSVGSEGDPFDPVVHEAVSYHRSDGLERPACTEILRPGYRVGGHLLRPAQVVVGGPTVGQPPVGR